jgi:hypothetical protein
MQYIQTTSLEQSLKYQEDRSIGVALINLNIKIRPYKFELGKLIFVAFSKAFTYLTI